MEVVYFGCDRIAISSLHLLPEVTTDVHLLLHCGCGAACWVLLLLFSAAVTCWIDRVAVDSCDCEVCDVICVCLIELDRMHDAVVCDQSSGIQRPSDDPGPAA